jgi:hypothetical protein
MSVHIPGRRREQRKAQDQARHRAQDRQGDRATENSTVPWSLALLEQRGTQQRLAAGRTR